MDRIQKRILDRQRLTLQPHTGRPIPIHEAEASFPKTTAMRLIEAKFNEPIEKLVAHGKIDEVAKRLGIERSTVSKWRKRIREGG